MSSYQNEAEFMQNIKRKAKICAVAWTIIYVLLLPLLSYFALLSAMIFDNPHLSIPKGLSIIFTISLMNKLVGFIDLLPIFAMPLSLLLMCFNYSKTHYNITRLCWVIPIFFFALALMTHIMLESM
jgi:hypothetical protein